MYELVFRDKTIKIESYLRQKGYLFAQYPNQPSGLLCYELTDAEDWKKAYANAYIKKKNGEIIDLFVCDTEFEDFRLAFDFVKLVDDTIREIKRGQPKQHATRSVLAKWLNK